jgi:hypothetical protein
MLNNMKHFEFFSVFDYDSKRGEFGEHRQEHT